MSDFLPPLVMELVASTKEFSAKLGEAGHEVERFEGRHNSSMARIASYGKAALAGIGGAAIAVGAESLHLADQWEASNAKMQQAIRNTGSSVGAWRGQISATEKRLESLGYTNAQVDESLAVLVTSTGNVKQALGLQGTAADLARFKHIGLSDASFMLSRALQGNSRVLKQLGIDLPVNAKGAESLKVAQHNLSIQEQQYQLLLDKSHAKKKLSATDITQLKLAHEKLAFAQRQVTSAEHAHTLILDALNQKIHGQATAYAETFSGKLEVLKTRTEDWGKNIGVWLIPKIETLVGWLATATTWLEKHRTEATALAAVIGGTLAVAIGVYLVSALMKVSEALTLTGRAAQLFGVQAAEGETAAELPLLPWIAAVAAVGIAAYELYKHWDAVWGGIKAGASDAWHFLDSDVLHPIERGFDATVGTISHVGHEVVGFLERWGPLALAAIVPFVGIPLLIWQHFDTIKDYLTRAWDAGYNVVKTGVTDVVSFIAGLPSKIASGLASLADTITSPFREAFAAIAHLWNQTVGQLSFHIPHWVPKIGGDGFTVPKIPGYAMGTMFAPGGLAWVGERGPELVNLARGSQVIPNNIARNIGSGGGGGGGGVINLTVNVSGTVLGADKARLANELAAEIRNALGRLGRRDGNRVLLGMMANNSSPGMV